MKTKNYYSLFPAFPGGVSGNQFVFQDWNGVELIQSGADYFVTTALSHYLVAEGLATIKKVWPVVKEEQYDEICGLTPPAVLHEVVIAPTLYDTDLSVGTDALIATKPVADELRSLNNRLRPKKCTPLSYKSASLVDPLSTHSAPPVGQWKETPLHWQAAKRYPLDMSGKLNHQDQFGFTPLHEAICADNLDAVLLLLEAGADSEKLTKHGLSAVDFILLFDRPELLILFLERNLLVNSKELIASIFQKKAQRCGHQLIAQVEDVNYRDSEDEPTYLMRAIDWKDFTLVEALLKKGANPNAIRTGLHQTSVLGMAIESWDPDLVKIVLEYGADPNQSILQRVPFYPLGSTLMTDSDPSIVALLMDHGANTGLQESNERSIRDNAADMLNSRITTIQREKCQLLLAKTSGNTGLEQPAS